MSDGSESDRARRGWGRLFRPILEIPLAPVLVGLTLVDYTLVGVLLFKGRVTAPFAGALIVFSLVAWWFAAWFYPFFDKSHARGPLSARFPIAVSQGLRWFAWLCLLAVHLMLAMMGLVGL
jgi:hypothetical protein